MRNGKRVDGTINVMIDEMEETITERTGEMTDEMAEDRENVQGNGNGIKIGWVPEIKIGIEEDDSLDTKGMSKFEITAFGHECKE
jgi:hypothetical protein